MKALKQLLIFLFSGLIFISACSKQESFEKKTEDISVFENLKLESSMKGWELYSWPSEGGWNYSLLQGTNRLKTYDEVVNGSLVIHGEETLMVLLSKLPKGEFISWIGKDWMNAIWSDDPGNLSQPDSSIIKEIKDYCVKNSLTLWVGN